MHWTNPGKQFAVQVRTEEQKLLTEIFNGAPDFEIGYDITGTAWGIVEKRWTEQGIWPDWNNDIEADHWKHELDGIPDKTNNDRETSRPIHQFIFQTTAERERLREKFMALGVEPQTLSIDINTMAHINIKNIWLKRKIWDETWVGVLPGLRWEHERHRLPSGSEISAELLAVQASLLQKYSSEINLAEDDSPKVTLRYGNA